MSHLREVLFVPTCTTTTEFEPVDKGSFSDQILVDLDWLAYADIEDGKVFMIRSVLVRDTDEILQPVFNFINTNGYTLVEDRTEDDEMYLHRRARIQRWELIQN